MTFDKFDIVELDYMLYPIKFVGIYSVILYNIYSNTVYSSSIFVHFEKIKLIAKQKDVCKNCLVVSTCNKLCIVTCYKR